MWVPLTVSRMASADRMKLVTHMHKSAEVETAGSGSHRMRLVTHSRHSGMTQEAMKIFQVRETWQKVNESHGNRCCQHRIKFRFCESPTLTSGTWCVHNATPYTTSRPGKRGARCFFRPRAVLPLLSLLVCFSLLWSLPCAS